MTMRGQTEVSDRHRIAKFVFAGPMDKGRHRTCADSTAERHRCMQPCMQLTLMKLLPASMRDSAHSLLMAAPSSSA